MRLAFCILVILPILHFALAAPVEMLEVRSNVVGVRKDDMAVWKKRMDSGSESESESESDYDYDEGEGEGVTEELESDANNDRKDDSDSDSDKDDSDSDGDGDNQSGVGVGYDADDPDNDNDNEHNDIAYDSSFTSLGAESPRPVVREPTDLEKIVGALSNALPRFKF